MKNASLVQKNVTVGEKKNATFVENKKQEVKKIVAEKATKDEVTKMVVAAKSVESLEPIKPIAKDAEITQVTKLA